MIIEEFGVKADYVYKVFDPEIKKYLASGKNTGYNKRKNKSIWQTVDGAKKAIKAFPENIRQRLEIHRYYMSYSGVENES